MSTSTFWGSFTLTIISASLKMSVALFAIFAPALMY
jgi:succinate-acetate transporter protein